MRVQYGVGICLAVLVLRPGVDWERAQTAHRAQTTVRAADDGVVYRSVGGQTLALDVYTPPSKRPRRPAVIIVHGGDWAGGDKRDVVAQGIQSAAEGWVAFAVNYRLAPAFPFPAALDDVTAAVAWVRANAARYGVDPSRVAAVGISAGGNLVGDLATQHGPMTSGTRIMAAVSWSGPMNLVPDPETGQGLFGDIGVPQFLGCEPAACPDLAAAASPYRRVASDTTPMLLTNATKELVPVQQAETMAARLAAFHVPHDLHIYSGPGHAEPDKAWPVTVSWLHSRFHDEHKTPWLEPLVIAAGLALVVLSVAGWSRTRTRRSAGTDA
ncbi:MAG: alpha/beta hydrolase [Actinobacteria bacterium]|nr:alpha/beta hydrolase [Actinomycetota bacterium]